MKPSIDIVIVNWNAGKHLPQCLESICTSTNKGFELRRVVVVDNASTDGSADELMPELPLTVIRNSENLGFAAACNQGARSSSANYLLFLNPDTRLLEDSLRVPIEFMEKVENSKIGICGIQLVGDQGEVTQTCSRFPTVFAYLYQMVGLDRVFPRSFPGHFLEVSEHRRSMKVDQVMGAFFLIRRAFFEALNGFDERFFVYCEDVDISYRASLLGCASYYLASAHAYHKGRACSDQVKATRLFYLLRSRILYSYKHFSVWGATLVTLGTLLIEPYTRIAWEIFHGSIKGVRETVQGYAMFWRALPGTLRKTNGIRRGPHGHSAFVNEVHGKQTKTSRLARP